MLSKAYLLQARTVATAKLRRYTGPKSSAVWGTTQFDGGPVHFERILEVTAHDPVSYTHLTLPTKA